MRSLKEGESISAFMASLRRLSEHCKYEAILDDMLRDRLVCGVRDKRIQQQLLAEPDLTFQKAMDLAEAAARNSQDLQASRMPKNESLLKVQNHRKYRGWSKDTTPVLCHRCGGGHSPKDCRFREAECQVFKNKGHIARACRSRKRVRSTHKVTQDQVESQPDDKEEVLGLHHTRSNAAEPMTVTVTANEADLLMEVDTGASASLISEATYKQLWQGNLSRLKKTNVKLCTYSGELLKVLGSITIDVVYEGQNQ